MYDTFNQIRNYKNIVRFLLARLVYNDAVITIIAFGGIYAKEVFGFELVPSAVSNAEKNAENNKIKNCSFYQGDLMNLFQTNDQVNNLEKPDVMVIDPPRAGMHPKTIPQVIELAPNKIIYVSCNPSTQVRDLNGFTNNGYQLKNVLPVDMFPHTPHIETVATLLKK